MSYKKIKTDSFFPVGRHYKRTIISEADVTKTGPTLLIRKRNRKKSMSVNDNETQAERLAVSPKRFG